MNRRPIVSPARLGAASVALGAAALVLVATGVGATPTPGVRVPGMTQVLGRPTDRSIALSVLAPGAVEAYAEFGSTPGRYGARTATRRAADRTPLTLTLTGLQADTAYTYRLRYRRPGQGSFATGAAHAFHTQRPPGSTFTFGLQGDSHPERAGKMYDAGLYARTMSNVNAGHPDFYLTLGDDFSLDKLITAKRATRTTVDQVYVDQRRFLGRVGSAAPLFLVNGNHEQADRTALNGKPTSSAVLAGTARNRYYPLPAPDAFYSGDAEKLRYIGHLRDYYAWTWGDALFVTIDPYWHSPVQVDNAPGSKKDKTKGGGAKRDLWKVSIGNAQYQWLKRTLEQSTAKYKFVFAHHVMGTGRGAVEEAPLYEWGGKDPSGADLFKAKRPGWELPIHQLMVKTGVTIFFQGHDHLYAHQELDGVVYQETPNPADSTYTAFNRDAYTSGTILPNTGHLRVTVSPGGVKVDYVQSFLAKDETATRKNGAVAASYTVGPRS